LALCGPWRRWIASSVVEWLRSDFIAMSCIFAWCALPCAWISCSVSSCPLWWCPGSSASSRARSSSALRDLSGRAGAASALVSASARARARSTSAASPRMKVLSGDGGPYRRPTARAASGGSRAIAAEPGRLRPAVSSAEPRRVDCLRCYGAFLLSASTDGATHLLAEPLRVTSEVGSTFRVLLERELLRHQPPPVTRLSDGAAIRWRDDGGKMAFEATADQTYTIGAEYML